MNAHRLPTAAEEHAFLCSVIYASIFEYPLTLQQLHESLLHVAANPDELQAWYKASPALQSAIDYRDGYFLPRGRHDLLALRNAREAISRRLLDDLRGPLSIVLGMPFVRMAALSGSLAHLNAAREADLDLFVVTRPGRVWSVTVTLLLISRLFGWRNRLCLNYVISERQLAVEPRDLFSANQIIHLRPLAGGDLYRRFLSANPFVADYYPNFRARPVDERQTGWLRRMGERVLDSTIAAIYERCCRAAYSRHLRRRAETWESHTQVRLEPECLKLHTSSHRHAVMEQFAIAVADAVPSGTCETVMRTPGTGEVLPVTSELD